MQLAKSKCPKNRADLALKLHRQNSIPTRKVLAPTNPLEKSQPSRACRVLGCKREADTTPHTPGSNLHEQEDFPFRQALVNHAND